MPIAQVEVFGSTMRDHVHKGPNQAGNKSLLTYRADLGVPGYTGYIPSSGAVVLPVKGFNHTGRPASNEAKANLTIKTADVKKDSEYKGEYKLNPDQTQPFSKTGGGYWITDRKLPDNVPFLGKSVYQTEVLDGPATTAKQLDRVDGLVCTLAKYEPARKANDMRRSQSVEPAMRTAGGSTIPRTAGLAANTVSGTLFTATGMHGSAAAAAAYSSELQRPVTVPTSHGELPGYQTTYANMTDKTSRDLQESLTTRRPHTSGGDPRFATLPRVMVPSMYGSYSTYKQDFGEESSDPMTRQPESKFTQTRCSTTRDLAEGTTRNHSHIPRYTGHIPASKYNTQAALDQGSGAVPRPDHKANCLLYQLDQYSRSRVPGLTTYKPQAAVNVTNSTMVMSKPDLMATTSGDATVRGTRFGVPHIDNTHYINSRAGLMTFFNNSNSGTEFVSDNGLFNAQVFYKLTRPGEGAMKCEKPSGVTAYGAPFKAAASMV